METQVHFISGLPRAGTTLLAAILRQNPRFHAAMSSPVGALVNAVMGPMGPDSEVSVFFSREKKRDIVRAIFEAYYRDQQDKDVIFDTNRLWCARLAAIDELFPDAKVICCARSVAWILDSFERLVRRNPYHRARLFNNDSESGTVFSRTEALTLGDRVVGFAYNALKEAFYGEHASRLLVVEYDYLAGAPRRTVDLIYQFLGERPFEHDFGRVEYDAPQFDAWLGLDGLHRVSGPVQLKGRQTVLPPEMFEKYDAMSFWKNTTGSAANVISTTPNDGAR